MSKTVVWFLMFFILTIIFYGAWFICMLVYASNIDKDETKLTEYKSWESEFWMIAELADGVISAILAMILTCKLQ